MDRQQSKVKHFLKLGYSHSDILRVLKSLQQDAQNNDILEELIKTCRTTTRDHTGAEGALSSSPQLVPRGCSSPQQHTQADTHGQQYLCSNAHASSQFRPVVIDGSNVAISHGNKQVFSCLGIQLAVQWFWERGIRDLTVFVPLWRREHSRPEAPITDQHILTKLEQKNILVYTPSRCIKGKRVVCYDDRYIVKLAYDSDGIIVSNDNYRDLQVEKPQWKKFIEERLLMYTFANDMFMPPDDPLGRNGPTIENFLRKKPTGSENKQQHCPYGKKCTYGVKCKFYHPERSNQPQISVADELRAKSQPESDTNCPASTRPTRDFTNSTPKYPSNTTYEPAGHARYEPAVPWTSANEDKICWTLSEPDLYCSIDRSEDSTYLQRSLPTLSQTSVDSSIAHAVSRLYVSDSALQTSLAYSSDSGDMTGSGRNHFLLNSSRSGLRRAHSPGPATLSHCEHAHSDLSISYASAPCTFYRYKAASPYSRVMDMVYSDPIYYPSAAQASHSRYPEVNWAQGQVGNSERLEQITDRRRDVRSQLSSVFPYNIVDKVMSLNPCTLDTMKLAMLIAKYRNSQML